MTSDRTKFTSLVAKKGGTVTFGDDTTCQIIGKGKIGNGKVYIDNVHHVEGLKYNLISVSQLMDSGHKVIFEKDKCAIIHASHNVPLVANREGNIYIINFENQNEDICLAAVQDQTILWHRRLGHVHMELINKLVTKNLVKGLPKLKYEKTGICNACQLGKQSRNSFTSKNQVSTSLPLQLLHLDLFGPERYASLGNNHYVFVIVDDFSRFTWVLFLKTKDQAFAEFEKLIKNVETKHNLKLIGIRSDHDGEFGKNFIPYCSEKGVTHEFFAPRMPQKNGGGT